MIVWFFFENRTGRTDYEPNFCDFWRKFFCQFFRGFFLSFTKKFSYTGGCIEWDSKEWDTLSLIGATREILEIRIEWDSIEWDKKTKKPMHIFMPYIYTLKAY